MSDGRIQKGKFSAGRSACTPMGNIPLDGGGTDIAYFFGSPPSVQMPYVVEDVLAGDGVCDVFFGVGCEDIGKERVRTLGRLVLLFDELAKFVFSLFNVISAAPCAMAGSTIDDGPGLAGVIEPEFRA